MSQSDEKQEPDSGSSAPGKSGIGLMNLIFAALSCLLAITVPLFAVFGSHRYFGRLSDFPEYYGAAALTVCGRGAEIYKLDSLFAAQHQFFPDMEGRGIAYYIPPFANCFLSPLALLPPEPAYWLYISSAFAALVAAGIITARTFKLTAPPTLLLLSAIFFVAPAFESLKIAQLAPFLFLGLSSFLYFLRRGNETLAAIFLSVLLLKPQELLPIAVYLLAGRRWKLLLILSGIGLFCGLISFFQIGASGYLNYFELLKNSTINSQFMQPELSATLRGQLLRAGELGQMLSNTFALAVMMIGLASIAYTGFKRADNQDAFESGLLFLVLPLGLITALHCHDYDLILLCPWILAAFLIEKKNAAQQALVFFLVLFLTALTIPIYVPIHYFWLMQLKETVNPLFVLFALSTLSSLFSLRKPGPEK